MFCTKQTKLIRVKHTQRNKCVALDVPLDFSCFVEYVLMYYVALTYKTYFLFTLLPPIIDCGRFIGQLHRR